MGLLAIVLLDLVAHPAALHISFPLGFFSGLSAVSVSCLHCVFFCLFLSHRLTSNQDRCGLFAGGHVPHVRPDSTIDAHCYLFLFLLTETPELTSSAVLKSEHGEPYTHFAFVLSLIFGHRQGYLCFPYLFSTADPALVCSFVFGRKQKNRRTNIVNTQTALFLKNGISSLSAIILILQLLCKYLAHLPSLSLPKTRFASPSAQYCCYSQCCSLLFLLLPFVDHTPATAIYCTSSSDSPQKRLKTVEPSIIIEWRDLLGVLLRGQPTFLSIAFLLFA